MKKIISLIAVALLLQACYKDKGNYDYQPLQEVTIKGIPADYRSLDGYATIVPRLLNTKDTSAPLDESKFTYKWFSLSNNQVIATTRNLENTWLNLAGGHDIRYQVTDQTFGKMFQIEFRVTVSNPYLAGFLIQTELEGQAVGLNMLSWMPNATQDTMRYRYIPDVLTAAASTLPPQTGPLKIMNFTDDIFGINNRSLILSSQSGSYRLDPTNFGYTPKSGMEHSFLATSYCPPGFIVENVAYSGSVSMIVGKGTDGIRKVYANNTPSGVYRIEPINIKEDGSYFKISSQLAYPVNARNFVIFNEETKGFLLVANTASKPRKITADKTATKGENPYGTIPSWDSLDMELVFMSNSVQFQGLSAQNDYTYAVLKDKNNECWLLRAHCPSNNAFDLNRWQKMENTHAANAEHFAVGGSEYNQIYYSVGSKVYEYNIVENGTGVEHEVLDVSSIRPGDEVTYLGFLPDNNRHGAQAENMFFEGKVLIHVGSYNAATNTSTFESYNVPPAQKPFEIYSDSKSKQMHRFEGIKGKIVSVCNK